MKLELIFTLGDPRFQLTTTSVVGLLSSTSWEILISCQFLAYIVTHLMVKMELEKGRSMSLLWTDKAKEKNILYIFHCTKKWILVQFKYKHFYSIIIG